MTSRITLCIAALLVALIGVQTAAANAGRFNFVFGNVVVVSADGSEKRAQRGMQVRQGDTIRQVQIPVNHLHKGTSSWLRVVRHEFAALQSEAEK